MYMKNRKRKVLSRRLLGVLALSVCFSITACGAESENESSLSAKPNVVVPKTQEEIFLEVKQADTNSRAYEGAYTCTAYLCTSTTHRTETMEQLVSCDVENGKLAAKNYIINENGEKQAIDEGKWFEVAGEDYWYYSDYENERCYKDTQKEGLDIALGGMPCEMLEGVVSFTLADDFNELTQAYEKVTTDSVTALQEKSANVIGNTEITTAHDNGVSVVQIDSRAEIGGEDEKLASYSFVLSLTEKDEKISEVYIKTELSGEYQGTPVFQAEECSISYTYAFDEALYNSITPCAETGKNQEEYIGIEFVYYDDYSVWGRVAVNQSESAADLFKQVEYDAFNHYARVEYSPFECTVEGWYLDEAHTQRFDAETIHLEDLLAVKKLYAKDLTVSNEWIFVAEKDERIERLSKIYKIVEGNGLPGGVWLYNRTPRILRANGEQRELSLQQGYFDEIYFQGVLTEETSVFVEGGKIYTLEFVNVYEDTDYNLFSPLFDIL